MGIFLIFWRRRKKFVCVSSSEICSYSDKIAMNNCFVLNKKYSNLCCQCTLNTKRKTCLVETSSITWIIKMFYRLLISLGRLQTLHFLMWQFYCSAWMIKNGSIVFCINLLNTYKICGYFRRTFLFTKLNIKYRTHV